MTAVNADIFQRLGDVIQQRTGLHFSERNLKGLERWLGSGNAGTDFVRVEELLEKLLDSCHEDPCFQDVIRVLTVGETYFFREKPVFLALEDHILPELISRQRQRGKELRLWSAGCATGEEPYSLAILLRRLIPDLPAWRVRILGTDINADYLKRAWVGKYRDFAFRTNPSYFRERHFRRCGDGIFEIHPRYREMVTFRQLNLADDSSSSPQEMREADVIFCRNVLIYLTKDAVRRLIRRLADSLHPGGWLLVGAAENSLVRESDLEPVLFPESQCFRKRGARENRLIGAVEAPAVPEKNTAVEPPVRNGSKPLPASGIIRREPVLKEPDRPPGDGALDPDSYFHQAMRMIERSDWDGARQAIRAVLYLEPKCVLAHFFLARLALREKDRLQAASCLDHVLFLLDGGQDDDLLPFSDGMSTGRMRMIVKQLKDREAADGG